MAISGREKIAIGRQIEDKIKDLKASKAREKIAIGREIEALLIKLKGGAVETVQTLFQQIAQGVKDTLGTMEVFNLIKQEIERIGRDVIKSDSAIDSQLKDACVQCAELADAEGIA